jgi:hypothetical protein
MGERDEANGGISSRLTPSCGECGYRLEGLAAEGDCPECGAVYHPERIVIVGWGIGPLESTSNAPPDRFGHMMAVTVSFFVAVALFEFIRRRLDRGIAALAWAALTTAFEWFGRWYSHAGADPTCHARIFPEGFGQRNGFGKCGLKRWRTAGRVTLGPTSNGRYRLQIPSNATILTPVSIEFECSKLQAVWLRGVIDGFRKGSG